jgi:[1-hydroxy-2-(trimethylamino)ethyl]phosphonate dioxygenase
MNETIHHPALLDIERLFHARGMLAYGEAISQLEHALQCATLASDDDAAPELVVAAWLHDIGHLQHPDASAAVAAGSDDFHHALGGKFLTRWFGPEVGEPVRLHVDAKRYLCATEPGYWDGLSALSQRTLEIQGGPMTATEAAVFEQTRFSGDAVRLRRWDDLGKQPGAPTRSLAYFISLAAQLLRSDKT